LFQLSGQGVDRIPDGFIYCQNGLISENIFWGEKQVCRRSRRRRPFINGQLVLRVRNFGAAKWDKS
jgi:hypothetical protein